VVDPGANGRNPPAYGSFSAREKYRQSPAYEAIERWSGDMSRVTLNFEISKIPFVHF